MARPFNELRNKMSPEARKRAAKKAVKMMAEMPLHELRRARDMSQEELARELHKAICRIQTGAKNRYVYQHTPPGD